MTAPVVTTTSIILSFNKTGYPRFIWKMAVKMEREFLFNWHIFQRSMKFPKEEHLGISGAVLHDNLGKLVKR